MNSSIKHPSGILGDKQFKAMSKEDGDVVLKGNCLYDKPRVIADVNIGPYGSGNGHDEFTGDCIQAYIRALIWVASKKEESALKSREFILAWCRGCRSFKGDNAPLECAWGAPLLLRSVEILKHMWKKWDSTDDRLFNDFLDRIIRPNLTQRYVEVKKWKNNWIFSIIEALIQLYMYRDQIHEVNKYITEYKDLLKVCIIPCGCNTENKRDMIHCQFQLASQIQIAEMLWHQGVDIYTPLLSTSIEYQARILNGEVPCELRKEDIKDNWFMPSSWEIGYNHYVNRKKHSMPHTSKLLTSKRPEAKLSFNWGPGFLHQNTG